MNLETTLDRRLWNAVRLSVEARKYTSAILDAIHLLTDVIRDRSGLDGDGVALVGQAFGGNSPKLKVTRMQTESERNIQAGTEAMLRGLYQAIRNPRSHGTYDDTERDANALLLLIDYLLREVDKSGSPFSLPALVERVLDPDFVPITRYAELLVAEIPAKKRLAVCRELFAKRAEVDRDKIKVFFDAILPSMPPEDYADLCSLISEELRVTTDEEAIRFVLGAFPPTIWPRLEEIARLRIENKLLASVKEGKWIQRLKRCTAGGLGTWTTGIVREMTLKDEFWRIIFGKLSPSSTVEEQDYVFTYIINSVGQCFDAPPQRLISCVKKGLAAGDKRFKHLADRWKWNGDLEERSPDDPWREPFVEVLANFTPAAETPAIEEEVGDIPF
jgi:uncharacterized protein (TIGR02391 family)